MLQLRKISLLGLVMACWLLWGGVWHVTAQEPRPTPTIDPGGDVTATPSPTPNPDVPTPTATPGAPGSQTSSEKFGTIRGLIYQDKNGDGKCIATGVAGEGPIAGVTVEFVSSDKQTVINLQSGSDGIYGLAAAGYSYWAVSAKPGSEWVVTSEKTLTVPIFEDSLVATNVNFCLQEASSAKVLLPASGAGGSTFVLTLAVFIGAFLLVLGMGLQWLRRSNK